MVRLLGSALILVVASSSVAHGAGDHVRVALGVERVVQQSSAVIGKARPTAMDQQRAVQLQVGGALALAQPAIRAVVPVQDRVVSQAKRSQRRSEAASSVPVEGNAFWLDADAEKTALAYPVSNSLSVGLGYRYVRGEDLEFKVANTEAVASEYGSHNVFLSARWQF